MSLRVGIVGCGDISEIYFHNARLFRDFRMVACADLLLDAAKAKAAKHGVVACSPSELMKRDDVDVVLNLTIPEAHADVSLAALEAGKHVYGEKPLATTLREGLRIMETAAAKGLRVGSAPDTVLGAALQTARRTIDSGAIGKPLAGFASVLSHGMEHWHPNPAFFFRKGGGPVFDMGPYYLTALVHLIGPVASVRAVSQIGFSKRVVIAPNAKRPGEELPVETPTSVQALLEFAGGAQITFLASWDVWRHALPSIELHGEKASLSVPDPNWFGGEVKIAEGREEWKLLPDEGGRFGRVNWPLAQPVHANYRGLGLADMSAAIREGRPHRAAGAVALHVLAVMAAMLEASSEDRRVAIAQSCERPAAFSAREGAALLSEA